MGEERKEYRIEGRPATIYKVVKNKDNPYVMIDRRPIDNPALSFKAKGILTYLMSRPDGWEVSVADLIKHAQDGEASVRAGLKELKVAGHMKYTAMRGQGRITGWLIEVFEVNSPDSDFQQVENQDVENRTQVLKTLSTNELNNGDKSPDLSKMPMDWKLAHGQEITADDVARMEDDKRKDAANLISIGFGISAKVAFNLAYAFQVARNITFPESKVKGQRKAIKEMLEMHVTPENVTEAVQQLTGKGMTVVDLFSVSKTAIDLANKPDVYNPNEEHRL